MRIATLNNNPSFTQLADPLRREFLPEAQFLACIRKERQRSDRSRAKLALVGLRLPALESSNELGLEYVIEAIPRRIRSLDEVGWLESGVIGLLLPETTKEGAWHLVHDLQRNDTTGYLRLAEVTVYAYPEAPESGRDDGSNGHSHPGERNGKGEHRPARVGRETSTLRVSAKESLPSQPLVELLLDHEPWWKRPLDILGSSMALIALSPLMIGAALAIKFGSPGPVLYSSWRVGKGGRKFRFHKFRTMCVDAEKKKKDLMAQNEASGPVFKMERDPRITPVGRILRKTSIDELPQFWNVLVGDMSLVGPRPPIPEETIWYEPWQRRRLELKGGLTCLWQISGRSNVSFEEWCRLDVKYHQRRSFLGDIGILLRTVPAVLTARGAK